MSPRAALVANSIELGLVFAGLALLWPLVFSREARARLAAIRPALAPWDAPLSGFLLFLWLIVCCGMIAQFAAAALFRPLALSEDGGLIAANAALEFGMLAGIAAYRFGFGTDRTPLVFAPAKVLVSGIGTFLVAMPVVVAVGLVWQFLLKTCGLPIEQQDMIGRLANAESPTLLVAMIVLATVTAPIAEELIFRAGFFRYLRTRLPRWAALLAPACLFGALHQNLATFAPLVALGIVFSLAYERTGRIGTSIVAHGLFNAHTIALIFIDPSAAN